jgi:hypothetical protein
MLWPPEAKGPPGGVALAEKLFIFWMFCEVCCSGFGIDGSVGWQLGDLMLCGLGNGIKGGLNMHIR